MSIGGITSNYPAGYEVKRTIKNTSATRFDNPVLRGTGYIKKFADTRRQTSVLDIYNSMSNFGGNISKAAETKSIAGKTLELDADMGKCYPQQASGQASETNTEIIVKPDGSRVLVITMSVGGMETTMSLEISKPTKVPNEISKENTENNMPTADNDAVSDEMLNVSSEA